jgi:hypothetical protein
LFTTDYSEEVPRSGIQLNWGRRVIQQLQNLEPNLEKLLKHVEKGKIFATRL